MMYVTGTGSLMLIWLLSNFVSENVCLFLLLGLNALIVFFTEDTGSNCLRFLWNPDGFSFWDWLLEALLPSATAFSADELFAGEMG